MTSFRHEPHALLTIPEAAQLLHVSDDTIRRQIREGDLPAIHLGTTPKGRPRYRIAQEVVTRLLQSSAVPMSPSPTAAERLLEVFAVLSDEQREHLLTDALAWAREQQPAPETDQLPPEPSREQLAQRMAKSRLQNRLG